MAHSILVVDDDAFFRSMLIRTLTALDCDFTYSSDGEECIEIIESGLFEYDIVLMDVHMPKLLGSDAARMIRNLTNNPLHTVPIIAMTGDPEWSKVDRLQSSGFTGFMAKPSDMESLKDAVTDCLTMWIKRPCQKKLAIN